MGDASEGNVVNFNVDSDVMVEVAVRCDDAHNAATPNVVRVLKLFALKGCRKGAASVEF